MILGKYRISYRLKWLVSFLCLFLLIYYSLNQLLKASIYGLLNIFTVDFTDQSILNSSKDFSNYLLLENFSDKESILLNTKFKIFFLQTSENEDILFRHGCSIESAARLHSSSPIFVLMKSKYIHLRKGSYQYLQSYKNIYFLHFDEQFIYSGTCLINLFQLSHRDFLHYFSISHLSDFLRTALLYKYGGIYFDLDVISIKTFDKFTNTVGLETTNGVNVAVLAFEKQHFVFDLQMNIQLKSIENQFQAFCWNCLGPLALTKALINICDYQQLHVQNKDKCHNVDIQPTFVFYPIAYQEIPQFFRRSSKTINFLIENSSIYSIHYFHHMTMKFPIEYHSPFAQIAQQFCPNIYPQLFHENATDYKFSNNFHLIFLCLFLAFVCILLFHVIMRLISYFRICKSHLSVL